MEREFEKKEKEKEKEIAKRTIQNTEKKMHFEAMFHNFFIFAKTTKKFPSKTKTTKQTSNLPTIAPTLLFANARRAADRQDRSNQEVARREPIAGRRRGALCWPCVCQK